MTIGTAWASVLKTEIPDAFTDKNPRVPTTCFIDGQIKLNKSEHIRTWQSFLEICFIKPIEFYFAQGTKRVVLAFDNYKYVPAAKGMTQAKRNKCVVDYKFADTDNLPSAPPENWNACMRNRVFKTKVIKLIINNLKHHFNNLEEEGCTLVLDHQTIEVYGASWQQAALLGGENRNGESDCKAYDYVSDLETFLIDSIDGDMIVLSLLYLNRHPNSDIFVRRIAAKTEEDKKRKKTNTRQYEFVSINHIASFLRSSVHMQPDPITAFCSLVAMAGCDFSRNLPRVGEAKLWLMRDNLRNCDLSSVDGLLSALTVIYRQVFQRSVRFDKLLNTTPALEEYQATISRIQKTEKISPKIRQAMWLAPVAECHCKNVIWTLLYWTERSNAPAPICPEYGYALGKNRAPKFAV